ncbi:OadG family transporter subunit [Chlorobium sp. KB01]|uniref:OadG family transporter subunit n=1 Tax=Chlorobium sp. KB01 TaxID=1917528 RepID=UPI0009F8DF98|nr:OadG family transporter subunit [Chlorobium sp. KB01]
MTTIQQILPIDLSAITSGHLVMAVTGYSVVFLSLFLLALLFSVIPKVLSWNIRRTFDDEGDEAKKALAGNMIPGEVSAAIGVAISLYLNELHDQDAAILTIKKVGKSYTPWNSKIYNVINFKGFQQ